MGSVVLPSVCLRSMAQLGPGLSLPKKDNRIASLARR